MAMDAEYLIPRRLATTVDTYGRDNGGRQKGLTIAKPLLIGCRSIALPEPIPNPHPLPGQLISKNHTHRWTIYVRPYYNEDISVWIKSVQFKLHDTYPLNIRTRAQSPFEVTETGWGDFEVQVKISFQDPHEKDMVTGAWVRLDKREHERNLFHVPDGTLVAEYYDEIVFMDPTATMAKLLNVNKRILNYIRPDVDYEAKRKQTIENIRKARERIMPEIEALTAQFDAYRELVMLKKQPDETSSATMHQWPSNMESPESCTVASQKIMKYLC